ncbi:MAG: acetate--CoA ligase family protein [Desulfobacula sp.]|nr:acetate--CoA ligase family protein [Desulfobacula sp.]
MKSDLQQWLTAIGGNRNPDEFEAKQLSKFYGINIPRGRRFAPGDVLNLDGLQFPCAIKVCSSKIVHKTEVKGVMLNNDRQSVKDNFKIMQQRFPDESLLVENQQIFDGPEFIIGIVKDPAFGHAVMIGAGGVLAEILNDTAFRLVPCSDSEALDMIEELNISPVFDNFRGFTLDKQQLAQTISRVSRLAHDMGDALGQLDINPIVFSGRQWVALDIKILFEG